MPRVTQEQQNLGGTSAAISRMRKVDPDFDIFELEDDAKEIFKVTYEAFLKGDEEYLTKVSDGEARGYFLANLAKREEMQMRPKFDHIWNMDHFGLHSSCRLPQKPPSSAASPSSCSRSSCRKSTATSASKKKTSRPAQR